MIAFGPGDRVIWIRNDGRFIPAVVEHIGPRRVLIRGAWTEPWHVDSRVMRRWIVVHRWVDPVRLSPRDEYVEVLDKQ